MIEAEPIEDAGFERRIIGRNAEHLPAALHRQGRDSEPEPEGCAELQLALGTQLMQSPERKTPWSASSRAGTPNRSEPSRGAQGENMETGGKRSLLDG